MNFDQRERAARAFLSVLGKPDPAVLEPIVTSDIVWTFPGNAVISGEAHGIDGVIARAQTIAGREVKVEIEHVTHSFAGGLALILHNTGERDGRLLDEHLSAVFAFEGDRIRRLDTYLSDVPMAEAYFA